jgi:hypothetical protein
MQVGEDPFYVHFTQTETVGYLFLQCFILILLFKINQLLGPVTNMDLKLFVMQYFGIFAQTRKRMLLIG